MRTYSEILDYLYSQLPMFQRTGPAAYKDNLDNTLLLDALYDHPHQAFRSIHVGGTNGKGSVSHMLASVLQEAGYKTGLYTSPHLKDFRERIRVNGEMIPEDAVVRFTESFIEKNKLANMEPSFFELTVSMAFDYFRQMEVDIAVVEVGLGGRLDSTNIITPEVSVITNISFDHQALLGNTLEKIAGEKAGIVKKNVPVVVGEWSTDTGFVFEQAASLAGTSLVFAEQNYQTPVGMMTLDGKQSMTIYYGKALAFAGLEVDLPGIYQRYNVPTVLQTIDVLKAKGWVLTEQNIRNGLSNVVRNTGLMGRWQIIGHHPLVVCDTGHNVAGIKLVVEQIRSMAWQNLHMVIGMVNDKDQHQVLALLPPEAKYYFTKASIPRAADPEDLLVKASAFGLKGASYPTVRQAFAEALACAGPHDLVFVGGSTFVVAEVL